MAARRTRSVRRDGRRASSACRLANSCHRGRCLGTTRPCRLVRASAQPPSRRWVRPAVESQGPPTVRPGWRRAGFALARARLGPPQAPAGRGRSAARAAPARAASGMASRRHVRTPSYSNHAAALEDQLRNRAARAGSLHGPSPQPRGSSIDPLEQPRGYCTTAYVCAQRDALTQSSPPWTAAAGTGRWQQWLAISVAAAALCVGGCYCATRVRA